MAEHKMRGNKEQDMILDEHGKPIPNPNRFPTYYALCDCGFEFTTVSLALLEQEAKAHMEKHLGEMQLPQL